MSGAQVGQFGKAARITQPALAERQEALTLLSYENHVVPGLLQTEAYARAVFSCLYPPISPEEEEERVSARLDRKQVLRAQAVASDFTLSSGLSACEDDLAGGS